MRPQEWVLIVLYTREMRLRNITILQRRWMRAFGGAAAAVPLGAGDTHHRRRACEAQQGA